MCDWSVSVNGKERGAERRALRHRGCLAAGGTTEFLVTSTLNEFAPDVGCEKPEQVTDVYVPS